MKNWINFNENISMVIEKNNINGNEIASVSLYFKNENEKKEKNLYIGDLLLTNYKNKILFNKLITIIYDLDSLYNLLLKEWNEISEYKEYVLALLLDRIERIKGN